jgi:hypothetical protein
MRSKPAAVVVVLSSVALLFGLNSLTASAATLAHAEVSFQAASLPIGLTGFSAIIVVLGLIGLAVGLTRLGRRTRAEKRAAARAEAAKRVERPARSSA